MNIIFFDGRHHRKDLITNVRDQTNHELANKISRFVQLAFCLCLINNWPKLTCLSGEIDQRLLDKQGNDRSPVVLFL